MEGPRLVDKALLDSILSDTKAPTDSPSKALRAAQPLAPKSIISKAAGGGGTAALDSYFAAAGGVSSSYLSQNVKQDIARALEPSRRILDDVHFEQGRPKADATHMDR